MHPDYLGDSYDIVKRFFCGVLHQLGYAVFIDPMLTGEWSGQENAFYRFLGVKSYTPSLPASRSTALFLDPDTGVNRSGSRKHVSYERIANEAYKHEIVFAFDQGFSRSQATQTQVQEKLDELANLGCSGLYYDSHARFLFISRTPAKLEHLRSELVSLGLPNTRFIEAIAASPSPSPDGDR